MEVKRTSLRKGYRKWICTSVEGQISDGYHVFVVLLVVCTLQIGYSLVEWYNRPIRDPLCREYLINYRVSGFLTVLIWLLAHPLLPPLLSVSSASDTQEDWEREKSYWRSKGGKGVGEEPNHTTARKPGPGPLPRFIIKANASSLLNIL